MWHPDCASCCAADKCHFCLQPAKHTFERSSSSVSLGGYNFVQGTQKFRCCTEHLLWLANHENAPGGGDPRLRRPGEVTLPLEEITQSLMARQPEMGGTGKRILHGAATLEVPAILR